MQGIIFNLLGKRISEALGEDYWMELVARRSEIDNPVFGGPKNYPDAVFVALATQVCSDRGVPRDTFSRTSVGGRFRGSRPRIQPSSRC